MKIRDFISHIALRVMTLSVIMLILLIFTDDFFIRLIISSCLLFILEIKGILTYQSPSDIEEEENKNE